MLRFRQPFPIHRATRNIALELCRSIDRAFRSRTNRDDGLSNQFESVRSIAELRRKFGYSDLASRRRKRGIFAFSDPANSRRIGSGRSVSIKSQRRDARLVGLVPIEPAIIVGARAACDCRVRTFYRDRTLPRSRPPFVASVRESWSTVGVASRDSRTSKAISR